MSKFQVGDTVVCTDCEDITLLPNTNYTVTKVEPEYLHVDGKGGYYHCRFKKVNASKKPEIRVGDYVKWDLKNPDNNDAKEFNFVDEKLHKVTSVKNSSISYDGQNAMHFSWRFVKVESQEYKGFRTGDKVVIKKDNDAYHHENWGNGAVLTVVGFETVSDLVVVDKDGGENWCFWPNRLEHYKEPVKIPFKVGDRVVNVGYWKDCKVWGCGKVGTVTKITDSGMVLTNFYDTRVGHDINGGFAAEELALAPPEEKKPKFKVGDFVKSTKNTFGEMFTGVMEVTDVKKYDKYTEYTVKTKKGVVGYFLENEFELAKKEYNFKIGDEVEGLDFKQAYERANGSYVMFGGKLVVEKVYDEGLNSSYTVRDSKGTKGCLMEDKLIPWTKTWVLETYLVGASYPATKQQLHNEQECKAAMKPNFLYRYFNEKN